MSSCNYLDNVPVKISENYKPPPRIYQVPQVIATKLLLPSNYYAEAPQFAYDFTLERKVLAKIPDWRRMRQVEKESRRQRKELREQERQRNIEAKHKLMLGAVSYPNAEELSSESDDETAEEKFSDSIVSKGLTNSRNNAVFTKQSTSCFNNILQPTIVCRDTSGRVENVQQSTSNMTAIQTGNFSSGGNRPLNSFNYKDFEEDTSSPFDNIELKTINDLDILAQVLTNTKLEEQKASNLEVADSEDNDNITNTRNTDIQEESVKHINNSNEIREEPSIRNAITDQNSQNFTQGANDYIDKIESTNCSSPNLNFNSTAEAQQCNENIPNLNALASNTIMQTNCDKHLYTHKASLGTITTPQTPFSNHHSSYVLYNPPISNGIDQQHNIVNFNLLRDSAHNYQNDLYSSNYNGSISYTTHFSPQHNANVYTINPTSSNVINTADMSTIGSGESNLKSKSVPDIIKELRDELQNSEMRRSRNHSYNLEDDSDSANKKGGSTLENISESQSFDQLEVAVQKLAKNISSMGFPLERVIKIAKIYGTDDKKIIEHLILLSELMDLGFDEKKICDALVKFDNNKEKALEYLIS